MDERLNGHRPLARAARARVDSGLEAQLRVRAVAALLALGEECPVPLEELRWLLEEVANDPPRGARGAQARMRAIELLDRLNEPPVAGQEQVERLFDESRDPDSTVEPDDWHPSADPAWHRLDASDTLRTRRRWYRALLERRLAGRLRADQGS